LFFEVTPTPAWLVFLSLFSMWTKTFCWADLSIRPPWNCGGGRGFQAFCFHSQGDGFSFSGSRLLFVRVPFMLACFWTRSFRRCSCPILFLVPFSFPTPRAPFVLSRVFDPRFDVSHPLYLGPVPVSPWLCFCLLPDDCIPTPAPVCCLGLRTFILPVTAHFLASTFCFSPSFVLDISLSPTFVTPRVVWAFCCGSLRSDPILLFVQPVFVSFFSGFVPPCRFFPFSWCDHPFATSVSPSLCCFRFGLFFATPDSNDLRSVDSFFPPLFTPL